MFQSPEIVKTVSPTSTPCHNHICSRNHKYGTQTGPHRRTRVLLELYAHTPSQKLCPALFFCVWGTGWLSRGAFGRRGAQQASVWVGERARALGAGELGRSDGGRAPISAIRVKRAELRKSDEALVNGEQGDENDTEGEDAPAVGRHGFWCGYFHFGRDFVWDFGVVSCATARPQVRFCNPLYDVCAASLKLYPTSILPGVELLLNLL